MLRRTLTIYTESSSIVFDDVRDYSLNLAEGRLTFSYSKVIAGEKVWYNARFDYNKLVGHTIALPDTTGETIKPGEVK